MATVAQNHDQLREAISEALQEFGLRLEVVTWKEDLTKRSLTLSLKIGGELDVQQDLPFSVQE